MKQFITKLFKSTFAKVALVFAMFAMVSGGAVALAAVDTNTGAAPRYSAAQANVSGGECDDNAIIRCGVGQSQIASAVAGLDGLGKAAYAHAGIPGSCSFASTVVGVVTRDNRVVVGGQTVATNAYTYGRQNMSGSVQIPGGAYRRPPSVSFRSSSITAWVCMDGKEFKWAVISTCGNPTTGTPTHKNNPRIKIEKTVSKQVVQPGEKFNYTIKVTNTGNVALKNVVVRDVLPSGLKPVGLNPGVTYNAATRRITWPTVPRLPVGSSFTKVFKVEVAKEAVGRKINTACVITNYNPNIPICDDVPVIIKKPKITIQKDVSVTAPVDVNQEFTYTIKVTNTGNIRLTNVKITDTLPDGVIAVANPDSRTVSFTIAALNPGQSKTFSFKAKATESAPVDTLLKNVACIDHTDQTDGLICDDADITVKKPVYSCDALAATKLDRDSYRFKVSYTAKNGAVLKNIAYNFGDGSSVVNTTNTTVDHNYAQAGEYTARAILTFTVKGEDKVVEDAKCVTKVVVEEEPVFSCDALNVATTDADGVLPFVVHFDAEATAENGAVIQSYIWNFGDGHSDETTGSSTSHSYEADGEYTATVRVKTNLGTTAVNQNCSKKITVKHDQPEEPVYTCDALEINKISDVKYSFEVHYTALNGAVLKNIAYDFGDGSAVMNTTDTTVEHTYAKTDKYVATATLTFTVDGQDKVVQPGDNCTARTDKPPKTPMCPYPGKEHLPKDHPDCVKTPPETPPETPPTIIPDTGAGEVVGMFVATTFAGMIAYRLVWLRRYQ